MKASANLAEKLATFTDRFSPRTVATYNDNDIMVAKLEGPFHWHKHEDTDDFFLVLSGTLDIELRDRTVTLNPGEVFVVPKGVEHRPEARGNRPGHRIPATEPPRRLVSSSDQPAPAISAAVRPSTHARRAAGNRAGRAVSGWLWLRQKSVHRGFRR